MKKYVDTKNIIKSTVVFILFFMSVYFAYIPMILFNIEKPSTNILILLNCFSNVVLFFIFFLIYRKDLRKEWKIFSNNKLKCINTGFKYWFSGLLIMVFTNYIINTFMGYKGAENEQIVQSWISNMPYLMLFNVGLLAPFNEEITFRKTFRDVFKNKWMFAIISGFIFGLAHVAEAEQYIYILPYGILGLMFCLAYDETKTIFTPLCFHMFHNIAITLISILL